MVTINLRMPEDVIEDLKCVAPVLGFSGYSRSSAPGSARACGADLERLETNLEVADLVGSLRRRGVEEDVIVSELAEARITYAV